MVSFYLNNLDRKYWPRVITSKAEQQLQNNFNQGLKIGSKFTSFGQNSSTHVLGVFFTIWKKSLVGKKNLNCRFQVILPLNLIVCFCDYPVFCLALYFDRVYLPRWCYVTGPFCASYICIFHLKYIEDGVSVRNPPLALFNNSTYSDKASQSIVKYLSIWVD